MDDLGVPLFLETLIYPTFFPRFFFAANVTCGFVEKRDEFMAYPYRRDETFADIGRYVNCQRVVLILLCTYARQQHGIRQIMTT